MKTQWIRRRRWVPFILMPLLPAIGFAEDWEQLQKIVATDRAVLARFGASVSVDGDYAVIGACLEATDASGGNSLYAAGAAYVFIREGDTWVQKQKLVASDRHQEACFGISVALSGNYAIVGAYGEPYDEDSGDSLFRAGAAYVFERSGDTWAQRNKIAAFDRQKEDGFGLAVSISGDHAIVGAYNEDHVAGAPTYVMDAGSAYIFVRTDTGWTHQQKITPSDRGYGDWFGFSVSMSGEHAIIGSPYEDHDTSGADERMDAGSAYLFTRIDTTWIQSRKLVASDRAGSANFGFSVSLDGDYAVAGSPGEDYDTSGHIVPQAGAAYVFVRNGADWDQQQKIFAAYRSGGAGLGSSVSISGDHVIAGAPGPSRANIFARTGSSWTEQKQLTASDHMVTADFGSSVSMSGDHAIIGAPSNYVDTSGANPLPQAGAAYIFGPGPSTGVEPSDFSSGDVPRTFRLGQNYPNPFNPTTTIEYTVGGVVAYTNVRLAVFDILGRQVATLVDENKPAGRYTVHFDAANLASGTYFYRLKAGSLVETKKMLLLR